MTKETTFFSSLEDLFEVNTEERVRGTADIQAIDGKILKIPFKSITVEEEKSIRKQSTNKIKLPNKQFQEIQDETKYNALLIVAATDEKNTNIKWNDPKLAEMVGLPVPVPELIIPKMLSLGGIVTATQYIIELSGLGSTSFEEEIDSVKN